MPVIGQRPEIALDDIVFATDFSPASERAAAYAAQLARRYKSCLHVVSVVDLNVPVPSGDGTCLIAVQEMVESQRRRLDELVATMPDVHCLMHVAESFSVSQGILALAAECGAALVVMGTTSKGALKKLLLGSVAEEVIRAARVPVLTVGPHATAGNDALVPFQRIVFANDLSAQAVQALPMALAFAEDGGARLFVCRVIEGEGSQVLNLNDGGLERSLERLLPPESINWCEPEYVIEHGDPAKMLLSVAEKISADLIVLGSRRSTFRLSYMEKGVTPAVIAQANCPVLTLCT